MGKGGTDMTQNQKILEHMMTKGTITPLEAMNEYGIMRLSGRIYDLRHMGYNVHRKIIAVRNRDGESAYVAQYSLDVE
jgi:cbb3-type cytochrome oxidase cytochrome c subunit